MTLKNRIIAVTPLVSLIIFLTVGYVWGIWHPTWAVFFLIIIVPIVLNADIYRVVYPLACGVIYVSLGLTLGVWHPAWIIFLTIPVYYILFEPYLLKRAKKVDVVIER
ncbi:MAG: hypothetical protein IJM36_02180 [Acholeplasmatales bacterium]|nr:hypothetical protein [Acholeplasmatales bacterium]